jgi:phosphoglycolate phosphatase
MEAMNALLTRADCALFDLDGTLVDTNIDFHLMKRRLVELAVEHGLAETDVDSLDILAIVEHAADHLLSCNHDSHSRSFRQRAGALLEEIELRHAERTQPVPFAMELVTALKERQIKVGIVTRNCREASVMSLRMTGIVPDVLICREDAKRHKPHPEQLFQALGVLEAAPNRSVMTGDHIMDVQSGKAAGMSTIGFLREDRPRDFFDNVGPDLVVRSLREVFDAIVHSDR